MKFRVIFLKKTHLYYAVGALTLLTLLIVLLSNKRPTPAFNYVLDNTTKKADLNGDGKEDILYIKTENNKYYLQVNTQYASLYLQPDKRLNTVGTYYPYCPMRLTLKDISRNKTPEIFIQALDNGKQIQHIFNWNSNKFEDIFCSSNSIMGFSDSGNSKTPQFYSGTLGDIKIYLTNYMLIGSKLETIKYPQKDNFMGKDSIYSFIKYIQSLPEGEAAMPKEIFCDGLSGKDLALIGKLAGENNTYTFQNATFSDNKWNKVGKPTDVTWSISFKGTSNTTKDLMKNYTVNIKLRPEGEDTDVFYFKIYSMSLE